MKVRQSVCQKSLFSGVAPQRLPPPHRCRPLCHFVTSPHPVGSSPNPSPRGGAILRGYCVPSTRQRTSSFEPNKFFMQRYARNSMHTVCISIILKKIKFHLTKWEKSAIIKSVKSPDSTGESTMDCAIQTKTV